MEKEFVPYDIALAMKELGFTEKVLGHYWLKDDDEDDEFKQYFKGYIALSTPEDWNTDKADYICSAPLYQQAFDYLMSFLDDEDFLIFYKNGNIDIALKKPEVIECEDKNACLRKLIEICQEKN